MLESDKNKAATFAIADTTLRLTAVHSEREKLADQLVLERASTSETPYEAVSGQEGYLVIHARNCFIYVCERVSDLTLSPLR